MISLNKYPFKAMMSILDGFPEFDKKIDIYGLQRASNACFPDTYEVTYMIAYLTHFGQVENTKNGWIRTKERGFQNKVPRRKRFLEDLILIIKSLSSIPQTTEEIGKKTGIKTSDLIKCLEFLEKLSERGKIIHQGENYQESWLLAKH